MLSFFDDFEKMEEVDKKSTSLLNEKDEKEKEEKEKEEKEKENGEKEEISINDVVSDVNELKKSINDIYEIVKLLVDNKEDKSNNGTNTDCD